MYFMYNELEFDRKCRGEQLVVFPIRSPVLVKTPKRGIYSASEEHRWTLNCLTSDVTLNITSAVVRGVGEFRRIDMCDVSEEFKVLVRIHGRSVFSEQLSEIEKELFTSEQEIAVKVLQVLKERLGTLGVRKYRPEDIVSSEVSPYIWSKMYAAEVEGAGGRVTGTVANSVAPLLCREA
ncbi:hypothetical protein J6590_063445 [Homalodisca vitripennis]|nr:hypothetical protein J6590_063445 [Homalodisca vitripennis]